MPKVIKIILSPISRLRHENCMVSLSVKLLFLFKMTYFFIFFYLKCRWHTFSVGQERYVLNFVCSQNATGKATKEIISKHCRGDEEKRENKKDDGKKK